MAPPAASLADVQALLKTLIASVGIISERMAGLERRVEDIATLQRSLHLVSEDVSLVRKQLNNVDQESRGSCIRIMGLTITEAELEGGQEKAIMRKAYDKLIQPILTAAKTKGDIDSVPIMHNLLEQGRFVSKAIVDKKGRTLPPVCLVRFSNRYMRNTVMRLKKDHMPDPSDAEKAAGTSKYIFVEDLTQVNAKKLKEFRDSQHIERAWTVDGRIRFTVVGDINNVRRLASPFISVEEALNMQ